MKILPCHVKNTQAQSIFMDWYNQQDDKSVDVVINSAVKDGRRGTITLIGEGLEEAMSKSQNAEWIFRCCKETKTYVTYSFDDWFNYISDGIATPMSIISTIASHLDNVKYPHTDKYDKMRIKLLLIGSEVAKGGK